MTQLADMREYLAARCEAEGHKMQVRVSGPDYRIERCLVCGAIKSSASSWRGRLHRWLDRGKVEREPWWCEFAYPGPLGAAFAMRLAGAPAVGDTVPVRLQPLTWRVQPDGRVSEFGKLGDALFRVIWRDPEQRIAALTGGWPDYKLTPVAIARLHPYDPVQTTDGAVEGDMVIVEIAVR